MLFIFGVVRYGWARDSAEFLSELAKSPRSKYVVLKELKALYDESGQLHLVSYNDVASIVDKVYTENGFNKTNDEIILIFLGIDETNGKGRDGEAYWALDLTPKGKYEKELDALAKGKCCRCISILTKKVNNNWNKKSMNLAHLNSVQLFHVHLHSKGQPVQSLRKLRPWVSYIRISRVNNHVFSSRLEFTQLILLCLRK